MLARQEDAAVTQQIAPWRYLAMSKKVLQVLKKWQYSPHQLSYQLSNNRSPLCRSILRPNDPPKAAFLKIQSHAKLLSSILYKHSSHPSPLRTSPRKITPMFFSFNSFHKDCAKTGSFRLSTVNWLGGTKLWRCCLLLSFDTAIHQSLTFSRSRKNIWYNMRTESAKKKKKVDNPSKWMLAYQACCGCRRPPPSPARPVVPCSAPARPPPDPPAADKHKSGLRF